MGAYLDQIPVHLRDHIVKIAATAGIEEEGDSTELIAQAWLEKKDAFEKRIAESGMEEIDEFGVEEERGALVLTYSGSLLTIGPLIVGKRAVEYTSIGLRKDVPESALSDRSALAADLRVDETASFTGGPIAKSSAVFKIAVSAQPLEAEEERDLLSEVTQLLTEDFVEVNKTVIAS